MQVLMVTSSWPTPQHPEWVPFIVQRVEFLRRSGVTVEVFTFQGSKHPLKYWWARKRLRNTYDLCQYDIIHAQFGQSGLLALPAPIPLVTTFHGSDLQGYVNHKGQFTLTGRLLQQASRWVARRSTRVVIVSPHLAAYLPENVAYQVIPCGLNLDLFRPIPRQHARAQLQLPAHKKLILFAADPSRPEKRHPLAKTVVDSLPVEFKAELLVVEDVPHEQMPLYMNACDALLLTSKHEGSPTVIKEALACNIPVIATDVGDVRSRIGGVEGCAVVPVDDQAAMASKLEFILHNYHSIDGRKAVADLSEDKLVEELIHVYRNALNHAN